MAGSARPFLGRSEARTSSSRSSAASDRSSISGLAPGAGGGRECATPSSCPAARRKSVRASRSDLATAYRAAGRLEDAITVFRRTLKDQELILGEDHPTTAATRGGLASALHSAGRMQDATPLYVRTLADRERVLGPDPPDTMTARANMAYDYR